MATISATMRDLLIAHIDGPSRVVVSKQNSTRHAAIAAGYIRPDFRGLRLASENRPRETFLTPKGRHVLAAALADWAEALLRADRISDQVRSFLADISGKVPEAEHLDKVG